MSPVNSFGRLYARPSFAEGAARNLDIFNTLHGYNESKTAAEADAQAMKNDWHTVGDDFRSAISLHEQQRTQAI